jgi:RNA methyltransferase, TrmH family
VTAGEWQRLRDSGPGAAGVVLLDGFHAVKHALRFGAEVLSAITADRAGALVLADALAPDLTETLDGLLVEVDSATFALATGRGGHHTGVAALARRARWSLGPLAAATRAAPLVLLDGPRQPGNVGAVVRVAAGLGAAGVVSTGTLDPWHPAVVRGGAGLHYAVPVLRLSDGLGAVEDGPADLAALEGPLVALDATGRDARGFTIPDNAVLAFGSERRGLSPQVRARADELVALPMQPGVASYNLATAVAMALYQWLLAGAHEPAGHEPAGHEPAGEEPALPDPALDETAPLQEPEP